MRRFGRVVLGGTFDRLHPGHEALLATAFRVGRSVAIGLTTDGYLARHPKPDGARIAPYRARRAALGRWLAARYPPGRWSVVPLEDAFGRSVEDGVDALLVSADTVAGGRAVNAERRRRGRAPVPLVVVPLVLAEDLRPVSSRRLRSGEIDREGRRRAPIRIALAVESDADRAAVARGLRRAFSRARIVPGRGPGPARRPRRPARASRAPGAAELTVTVRGRPPRDRSIVVATPSVTLAPRRLRARSPAELSAGVAAAFRRAGRTKGFNPRPR